MSNDNDNLGAPNHDENADSMRDAQTSAQDVTPQHGGPWQGLDDPQQGYVLNAQGGAQQYGQGNAAHGQQYFQNDQSQQYGQNGYGQQYGQANAYSDPAYGQSGYGQQYGQGQFAHQGYAQPYGAMPGMQRPLAAWGKRVGASLLDSLIMLPVGIIAVIGFANSMSGLETTTDPVTGETTTTGHVGSAGLIIAMLCYLLAVGFSLWNQVWRQGKTGQSLGKKWMGISVVSELTGQPIGPGKSFLRSLAHMLDALPCEIGFLWPLWDAKKQTFADKIMNTVVIDVPKQ